MTGDIHNGDLPAGSSLRPAKSNEADGAMGPSAESSPAQTPPESFPTIPENRLVEVARRAAHRTAVGFHKLLGERTCSSGILLYHRVAEQQPGVPDPTFNVTPEGFRMQLQGILERGFRPWPLRKVLETIRSKKKLPCRVFAVTFDDGFENNYLNALPILEELGIPATIFLATAYLGTDRPFPFDDWSEAGNPAVPAIAWRPLSMSQCHELAGHDLIDLGAHTHTHDSFIDNISGFRTDLRENLRVLKAEFGVTRPVFAFPFGLFNPEMTEVVKELGLYGAATTRPYPLSKKTDPFEVGRYDTAQFDTAASLAAKLAGWYTPITHVLRLAKKPISALASTGIGVPVPASHPR